MKQNYLNTRQFALKLDINVGTCSYLLNGARTLTADHLDRITEVLGFPKGHFYENYIHEYLQDLDPNWRRIGPFLRKCAEIGKLDCIRETVSLLLDDLTYTTPLFDMAEELFENGNYAAAEILYENVAMSEKGSIQNAWPYVNIGCSKSGSGKTKCGISNLPTNLNPSLTGWMKSGSWMP